MRIIVWFLKWVGLSLGYISKLTGKGRGTAITGWLVEYYAPWSLSVLQEDYSKIIYITGTNGKTTTRSIIRHILSQDGVELVTNSGGANIMRGIASSILQDFKLFQFKKKILLLEVEEATLPKLSKLLRPNIIVITNLFRDQLDIYGDIETTKHYFEESIANLLPNGQLIINGKDPKLASLSTHPNTLTFGIDVPHVHTQFEGELINNNCDLIISKQNEVITVNKKFIIPNLALTGDYNLYNVSAALLTGELLGVKLEKSVELVSTFENVFGRGEKIIIENSIIELNLIKNPAGAELVLASIPKLESTDILYFVMNDNIADGKDVSWFCDIGFEQFLPLITNSMIYCGGTRKEDMKVRLLMAGITNSINFLGSEQLIMKIHEKKPKKVIILATYTAMLEVRKKIAKVTKLSQINDSKH